jgi:hypothetical protein
MYVLLLLSSLPQITSRDIEDYMYFVDAGLLPALLVEAVQNITEIKHRNDNSK